MSLTQDQPALDLTQQVNNLSAVIGILNSKLEDLTKTLTQISGKLDGLLQRPDIQS